MFMKKQIGKGEMAMKKMKFMLFAVAAMAAVSCAQEIVPEGQDVVEVNYIDMEFTSTLEGVVRTNLVGNTVNWQGNETISIFDNSSSPQNTKATTVSGQPGVFLATVPAATEYYAYYPYREKAKFSGAKCTNQYLAQVQAPAKNTFDTSRAPMMAKRDADGNLEFKNVASHVKFTIPEDMTDVIALTLWGNEDELITGVYDVEWNNGDPKVVISDVAQAYPYATLRAGNKSPLTPGDYYFTIFPTEFKSGFTVILSKADGTQVAIRTDKSRDEVSLRNNILPMKQAASTAFKSHMNYFVHYDNGFDLNISGYIVNSTKMSSKKVILVTNTKNNGTIGSTDGYLYFVSPNCSSASYGTKTVKDILIAGWDASRRSTLTLTGHMNLGASGTYYILSNLNVMGVTDNHMPLRGDISTFGDVVFSNCAFKAMTATTTCNFNGGGTANSTSMNFFIVEDCDFEYNTTTASYLMSDRLMQGAYKMVKINNNVFHGKVGSFRLLNIGNSPTVGSSVDSLIVSNNTFDNLSLNGGQVITARNIYDLMQFSGNLFCLGSGAKLQAFSMPGAGTKPANSGIICNDNYYYSTAEPFTVSFGYGSRVAANPLASNPLTDLWDPANGKFGAYNIVTPEGVAAPTVPVGAQRPDMDPVTSAENSAGFEYDTNDLGKL